MANRDVQLTFGGDNLFPQIKNPLPSVTSSDNGKILGVSSGAWGAVADKGAPYEVVFTITGLPSGTSYPVSVTVSLADIYEAVQRGDRVFASVVLGADGVFFGALSQVKWNVSDDGYDQVTFDIIGINGSTIGYGQAGIEIVGNDEGAWLFMVPLSTTPMYVNFTITGAAVDNVYPLSADKTLAEIDAAIKAGADVIGTCNIGGNDTPQTRIASTEYANGDLSFVAFSILGTVGGSPVMGVVEYDTNGVSLEMIPLQQQLSRAQGVNF